MTTKETDTVGEIRARLVDVAGRTTQDVGMGRIVGQVMGYVFLREEDCSLEEIAEELELSKAAVSIAGRQLESLRLLERVWKKGDRRSHYRTARHFGVAVQQGLLRVVRDKVAMVGAELDRADEMLAGIRNGKKDSSVEFLRARIGRGKRLRKRAMQLLDSPILKLLELTGTW